MLPDICVGLTPSSFELSISGFWKETVSTSMCSVHLQFTRKYVNINAVRKFYPLDVHTVRYAKQKL